MPTIAIVGNCPQTVDYGAQIDACDEVVRFSHCDGWNGWAGRKTTIWVQRSDESNRGPRVLHDHKAVLDRVLPNIHTVYVVADFFNDQRRWVAFSAAKMCRQYPFLCARVRPLSAKQLTWVCPNNHATNGLVFLHYVLYANPFPAWSRFLVGFDFAQYMGSHDAKWEQAIVERWIEHGHFFRMQPPEQATQGERA